jgi:hypothetical protein
MGLAEIWAAIQSVTADPHDRQTLLYATAAESGARPIAQIGGGPGMGYYQIEAGQGVTRAQANDPVQATKIFFNRWPVHACATEQGQLWQTDADQAATNAAGCAERNAAYLAGQPDGGYGPAQRQAQQSLWQQVTGGAAMSTTLLDAPIAANQGKRCTFGWALPDGSCILPGGSGEGPVNPVDTAVSALSNLPAILASHTFWIRALLVVGGLAGVLMGVKGLTGIDAAPVPIPV